MTTPTPEQNREFEAYYAQKQKIAEHRERMEMSKETYEDNPLTAADSLTYCVKQFATHWQSVGEHPRYTKEDWIKRGFDESEHKEHLAKKITLEQCTLPSGAVVRFEDFIVLDDSLYTEPEGVLHVDVTGTDGEVHTLTIKCGLATKRFTGNQKVFEWDGEYIDYHTGAVGSEQITQIMWDIAKELPEAIIATEKQISEENRQKWNTAIENDRAERRKKLKGLF